MQGKCREFQASREVSVQVGMASGGMHGHVWTPPPVGVINLTLMLLLREIEDLLMPR